METEVKSIPKIRRVYSDTIANLNAMTSVQDEDLAYGTDTTLLYRQNGSGAANWVAITSLAVSTKEFIVPFLYSSAPRGFFGYWPVWVPVATNYVMAAFSVPLDFAALTHAKVMGIKSGTGTLDWTAEVYFADVGEVHSTNSDSDTANGLAMTNNEIEEVDISAAFTGIAAGAKVGVKFTMDAFVAGAYKPSYIVIKYA